MQNWNYKTIVLHTALYEYTSEAISLENHSKVGIEKQNKKFLGKYMALLM